MGRTSHRFDLDPILRSCFIDQQEDNYYKGYLLVMVLATISLNCFVKMFVFDLGGEMIMIIESSLTEIFHKTIENTFN